MADMARRFPRYIPALSFRWLTPLYDPLLKWGMREETFKRRLLEQVNLQPGQRALDLGCGTGTLTVMLKQSVPGAQVTGLDGDEQVLAIAREKARQSGLDISWDFGLAYELPYPESSFDVVLSSLVIHHLTRPDKVRTFREANRVLRPGGGFHLLDFGPPYNLLTRLQAAIMTHLEEAADHFAGRILPMLQESGFDSAEGTGNMDTVFGPVSLYRMVKRAD